MQCGRGCGEGHRKRAGEGVSPAGVRGALSLPMQAGGRPRPGAWPRYQGKRGRRARQFGWYRGFEVQGRPMGNTWGGFSVF